MKRYLIFLTVAMHLAVSNAQIIPKDSTLSAPKDSLTKALVTKTDSTKATAGKEVDYDRILKTNGEILIVTIKSENAKEIGFIYPLNTVNNFIPTPQVKELQYKNGTSKVIDATGSDNIKVIKTNNPEEDWKFVKVTYNKKDVEGLPELGPIDSKAEAKKLSTSTDILERNATLYIQKKAARMGASKVLINNKEVQASYGELPVVILTGTAYGR